MSAVRSRKYLDGARGSPCTLRIPDVCTGNVEQTVAAHIRDRHTGRSVKASDLSTCDACAACHDRFDGRSGVLSREDWLVYALRGLQETLERRHAQGLLVVSIDVHRPAAAKPRKPAGERKRIPHGTPPIPSRPLRSRAKHEAAS